MFYESERDEEEEERQGEQTLQESFEAYEWKDFWILVYTLCFTVPIPLFLSILFKRSKFRDEYSQDQIKRVIAHQKIKRVIGYFIALSWVAWCFYASFMFSLEFGESTTQIWIVNFLLSTSIEICAKDALVAVSFSIVLVSIILCKLSIKKNLG
jgi:hypothetical protein